MSKESRIEDQLQAVQDGTGYSGKPMSRIEAQLQKIIENSTGSGGGGGSSITVDSELSETSTNPVQNAVVTAKLNELEESIPDDVTIDDALSKDSTNAIQNKIITETIEELNNIKADIDSPSFTGTPTAPTADIQSNDLQVATTAFVKAVINAIVNGAPETLDTLKEIADAIEENDDVVAALNDAISNKLDKKDYVKVDTSDFLSTKKGGTVNNTFRVNKVSTTNPLGVVELEIANDGSVAINGSIEEGKNNEDTSMAYFKKKMNGSTISFNSDRMDLYSKYIHFQSNADLFFEAQTTEIRTPNYIGSPNGLVIAGKNNGIHLRHNGESVFDYYGGIHIGNDIVSINYKDEDNTSKPLQENDVAAIFDQYNEKVNIYTPNIEIGPINDKFIQCRIYPQFNNEKDLKLRGGTNASILIDRNNNIVCGSEGGILSFIDFSRDKNIFKIDTRGLVYIYGSLLIDDAYFDSNTIQVNNFLEIMTVMEDYGCGVKFDMDATNHKFYLYATNENDNGMNGASLGISYSKWENIYATNGTIQTSDRNEKNTVYDLELDHARSLIMGAIPKTYRMNNGTSGRTHWGLISQDVEKLLTELGWSSLDFAGFIKSPKIILIKEDENGNKLDKPIEHVVEGEFTYSLRYDEFISPLIKVTQDHESRLGDLEDDNETLKSKVKEQDEKIRSLEQRISALEALLSNS